VNGMDAQTMPGTGFNGEHCEDGVVANAPSIEDAARTYGHSGTILACEIMREAALWCDHCKKAGGGNKRTQFLARKVGYSWPSTHWSSMIGFPR
jgi:hypothetical protein